jgi:Fic family protein
MERGRLSVPLLYLSAYIEAHRQKYYALLERVRTHGDWDSWIRFFLGGVRETATAAVKQADYLLNVREVFRSYLGNKPRALALVDHLFVNPYMTVARAAEHLGTSNQTARQAVRVLEDEDILQEVTGRRWGRVYLAAPILAALEGHPEGAGTVEE